MYSPRVGDYGVVKTNGWVGWLIRVGTVSRWNHAFVYVGDGTIVEANPSGIEYSPVSKYENIAWNRHEDLSEDTRIAIANNARYLVGKAYSFLTIALIAFRILGVKSLANLRILQKFAEKEGYICSELVAECYSQSGVDLCDQPDYRVVPGDLAERLIYQ